MGGGSQCSLAWQSRRSGACGANLRRPATAAERWQLTRCAGEQHAFALNRISTTSGLVFPKGELIIAPSMQGARVHAAHTDSSPYLVHWQPRQPEARRGDCGAPTTRIAPLYCTQDAKNPTCWAELGKCRANFARIICFCADSRCANWPAVNWPAVDNLSMSLDVYRTHHGAAMR